MAMRQTQKATNQAMTHWLNATPAAFQPEPSSRFTAEMAATQGVYSRVNTRNTVAVKGVNSEPRAAVLPPSSTVKVLALRVWETGESPQSAAQRENLWQIQDEQTLLPVVQAVLADYPAAADDYRRGKQQALQLLLGQVIRRTAGRADPQTARCLLVGTLSQTL